MAARGDLRRQWRALGLHSGTLDGLGVWLFKLGVGASSTARPYHPQSRGKNERFHRTLQAEVFAFARFPDLAAVQRAFDRWRAVYNLDRPHEALGQDVPASRYRPSQRPMPDGLPEVEYEGAEVVRAVSSTKAYVSFKGRLWKVPQAFCGERLAIRPLNTDGQCGVFSPADGNRNHRLDQQTNHRPCLRTAVCYVPGLNKSEAIQTLGLRL